MNLIALKHLFLRDSHLCINNHSVCICVTMLRCHASLVRLSHTYTYTHRHTLVRIIKKSDHTNQFRITQNIYVTTILYPECAVTHAMRKGNKRNFSHRMANIVFLYIHILSYICTYITYSKSNFLHALCAHCPAGITRRYGMACASNKSADQTSMSDPFV